MRQHLFFPFLLSPFLPLLAIAMDPAPLPLHDRHDPTYFPFAHSSLYIQIVNSFLTPPQQQIDLRCSSSHFHNTPPMPLLPSDQWNQTVPEGGSVLCVIRRMDTNITKTLFVCNPNTPPSYHLHAISTCYWIVSETGFVWHRIHPFAFSWEQSPAFRVEIWNRFPPATEEEQKLSTVPFHLHCWFPHRTLFSQNLSPRTYWGHIIDANEGNYAITCRFSWNSLSHEKQLVKQFDVWHLFSRSLPYGDCLWLVTPSGFFLNGEYVCRWEDDPAPQAPKTATATASGSGT